MTEAEATAIATKMRDGLLRKHLRLTERLASMEARGCVMAERFDDGARTTASGLRASMKAIANSAEALSMLLAKEGPNG